MISDSIVLLQASACSSLAALHLTPPAVALQMHACHALLLQVRLLGSGGLDAAVQPGAAAAIVDALWLAAGHDSPQVRCLPASPRPCMLCNRHCCNALQAASNSLAWPAVAIHVLAHAVSACLLVGAPPGLCLAGGFPAGHIGGDWRAAPVVVICRPAAPRAAATAAVCRGSSSAARTAQKAAACRCLGAGGSRV